MRLIEPPACMVSGSADCRCRTIDVPPFVPGEPMASQSVVVRLIRSGEVVMSCTMGGPPAQRSRTIAGLARLFDADHVWLQPIHVDESAEVPA